MISVWNDFVILDSNKGQWLLDVAAFNQWRIEQHNNGHIKPIPPPDKERYQQLRKTALNLYEQICREAQTKSGNVRIRFFKYLAGESMEEIAISENPPVTRQAIQKSLKQVFRGLTPEEARQIWFYGQHYK